MFLAPENLWFEQRIPQDAFHVAEKDSTHLDLYDTCVQYKSWRFSSVVSLLEVVAALRNLCLSSLWCLSWDIPPRTPSTMSYLVSIYIPLFFPSQIESSFRDWGLMNLCVSSSQHNVWHMEVFTYFSSELIKKTTNQLIKTSPPIQYNYSNWWKFEKELEVPQIPESSINSINNKNLQLYKETSQRSGSQKEI